MDTKRTYRVKVPPSEVLARVSSTIDAEGPFSEWGSGKHPHYGRVARNGFEIKLRTGRYNSFKPVLCGKVASSSGGSRVQIRVGMNSIVPMFIWLWQSGTLGFQILFLLVALKGEKEFGGWVLVAPSGMTLFGLLSYRAGKALSRSEGERLMATADQLWGPPRPGGEPADPGTRARP